ncbi:hypothetical protein Dda_6066 [Drechslerella dactyloides]|uniref:HNH nuclease domain-containing protein n=1 Tax=Drechslerella dactyloides TaxID=74499 RepID=A0AAD6IV54_DREDA|nr:hypothetical protein Dda_6066 [Drechslerella dactyloides]
MSTQKFVKEALSAWNVTPHRMPAPERIKVIAINHPSYDDIGGIFLQPYALDQVIEGQDPADYDETEDAFLLTTKKDIDLFNKRAGIHHGTLLLACFALTGGKNGVLSPARLTDQSQIRELFSRLETDAAAVSNEVLTEARYYYYPLEYFDNQEYEVLSSFRDWAAPNKESLDSNPVFRLWNSAWTNDLEIKHQTGQVIKSRLEFAMSNASMSIKARDVTCKMTGILDPLDAAHIVPEKERAFWDLNNLSKRRSGRQGLPSDPTAVEDNLITLNKNIHHVFDQGAFCFTVKENTFVAHFSEAHFLDTLRMLHNRPLRTPSTANPIYLFVRFAWTFFQYRFPLPPRAQPLRSEDHPGELPLSTAGVEPASGREGPTKRGRGQRGRGAKSQPEERPEASRKSERLNPMPMDVDGAQEKSDNAGGDAPFDQELERLREIGEYVEQQFPPGFFDSDGAVGQPLQKWQQDLLDVADCYPGCEETARLKHRYRKEHPEVSAVSNPEKVWEDRENIRIDGDIDI